MMDVSERDHYADRFRSFNLQKLDWDAIVTMAKEAGCRYIVLTARHHDGFSLYDTRGVSSYDVMHTPYGRDIVADFVGACRRHGLVPFLYHTTLDWQNPMLENDWQGYQRYLRDSLEILCRNYGRIGGFWFDGNWSRRDVDWQEDELYSLIRRYQPDAILINNSGLEQRGRRGNPYLDVLTFEQGQVEDTGIRDRGRHLAMEKCETMNHHWGAARLDLDYKSPRQLIEMLNTCRRNNANYLLNIGPKGDGSVPLMMRGLLEEIGIWTAMAGDNFYDGTLSSIACDGDAYVIDGDGISDVYVSHLPLIGANNVVEASDEDCRIISMDHVEKKIAGICWIDSGERLTFEQEGDHAWFRATGYPYGRDLVVRITRITWTD